MSIATASSLKNATAAAEAVTGRKFCRKCCAFKPLTGGIFALDSRRKNIWYCSSCTRKTSFKGSLATTPASPTPAKARQVTSKRDALAGLSDAWKNAYAPLEKL